MSTDSPASPWDPLAGSEVNFESFRNAPDAFLFSDSQGRIRMINGAAAKLLECDSAAVLGRHCWSVVGLRTLDGGFLCSPRCAVQDTLVESAGCERKQALRISSSGGACKLDLFTVQILPANADRSGVLHMLAPVSGMENGRLMSGGKPGSCAILLDRLTRRETQILRAIATGESSSGIAERLCISLVTVRNHVRAILRKLQVHNRLEAVLTWKSRFH